MHSWQGVSFTQNTRRCQIRRFTQGIIDQILEQGVHGAEHEVFLNASMQVAIRNEGEEDILEKWGDVFFWPGQSPFSQTWLLAIPEVCGDPVLSLQTNAPFAACALAGAPHDRGFPALNTTKNHKNSSP